MINKRTKTIFVLFIAQNKFTFFIVLADLIWIINKNPLKNASTEKLDGGMVLK